VASGKVTIGLASHYPCINEVRGLGQTDNHPTSASLYYNVDDDGDEDKFLLNPLHLCPC